MMNWLKAIGIALGIIALGSAVVGYIVVVGPRGVAGTLIAGFVVWGVYSLKVTLDRKDAREARARQVMAEEAERRLQAEQEGRLFVEQPLNEDGTPFRRTT